MVVLPIEAFSEYVENPLVRRLYLTDVGFFPKADHHYMDRKEGIEEYIFLYCIEGEGTIWVNGKKYVLSANEAFCIPHFQKHCYFSDKNNPWSILWVHFKGEDTQYFSLDDCRIVKFRSSYASNRMMFLFDLLFRALEGNYTLGNFIYISQVLSVVLAETYHREKEYDIVEQNKHVTNIVKYMYRNMEENLHLEDICEEFNLSKSYVNAIFLKCTQRAPMEFFTNLKMRQACNMLRSSEMYVYEIAQRLGYKDQYYFSRLFKKIVGMSPKEYKNNDFFYYK
ncbi:MAG: AraC family transcriptional regulator [Lachnospiraceae bacterium]|nr:AraC family transcriptional regulator [Lachnospiraceae bacterium]